MKKSLFASLMASSLILTTNTYAAGLVNYLNVKGDIVHFATDAAKTQANPACVASETAERFTLSLKSESGRAMYSLLITAMAGDLALEIESAQDCADTTGVERALGASIAPDHTAINSEKIPYLYTGDGLTKLGKIMNSEGTNTFYYLSADDKTQLQKYVFSSTKEILWYSGESCTGDMYMTTIPETSYHSALKRYIDKTGSLHHALAVKSREYGNGCDEFSYTLSKAYGATFMDSHALCGALPCLILEE